MKRIVNIAVAFFCLGLRCLASTYYIDTAGSDSNNGTSKSTPWAHHPYMANWGGSGYVHAAGDQFIFKGGETWVYACFPLVMSNGGSSGSNDYYGVDKTWYTGASWVRPIFDGQYKVNNVITFVPYATVDNLEICHINSFGGGNTSYIYAIVNGMQSNVLLENCYVHGWLVGAPGGVVQTASSTSTNTIGSGTKTFTVSAGLTWLNNPGSNCLMTASSSNYMGGNIVSYSGTTLTVSEYTSVGSGTYTSWTLQLGDGNGGSIGIMGGGSNVQSSSTSSVSIGTGSKTFAVSASTSSYPTGCTVTATEQSDSNNYAMYGTVTSFNGSSMVLNVLTVTGSGTYSSWNIFGPIIKSNAVINNCTITDQENQGVQMCGCAVYGVQTISNSTIHDVSSAVLYSAIFNNNQLYNVSYPASNVGFDQSGEVHFNGLYLDDGGYLVNGVSTYYVYDNYVHDYSAGANGIYVNPHGQVQYIYNNVIYGNQSAQGSLGIDTYAPGLEGGGTVYIFNNTIFNFLTTPVAGITTTGVGGGRKICDVLVLANNQVIDNADSGNPYTNAVQGTNVTALTNTDPLLQQQSVATAQGYTAANLYRPTTGGATIGAGANVSSAISGWSLSPVANGTPPNPPGLSTDILGNARPTSGAWDIGAYEYVGTTLTVTNFTSAH